MWNRYESNEDKEKAVDEKVIMGDNRPDVMVYPESNIGLEAGSPIVADFSGFEDINEGRALGMDMPHSVNKVTSQMVFQEDGTNDSTAMYSRGVEQVHIAKQSFEDLGRPSSIDVTVRRSQ